MLKRSIAWGDPLHYSRKLLLELWHDSGLVSRDYDDSFQSEFLGEVDYTLDLPTNEPVRRRVREQLVANNDKARRKVSGTLTFEYSWEPLTHTTPNVKLLGRLEVTVVNAENLLNIDWKGTGVSDPYCLINAYPNSPSEEEGLIMPARERTKTVFDSTAPTWNETVCFDVCWTQEGTDGALLADMRQISRDISKSLANLPKISGGNPNLRRRFSRDTSVPASQMTQKLARDDPATKALAEAEVLRVVPALQGEVERLKDSVPQLQREITEVHRDMQFILSAVRKRRHSSSGLSTDAVKGGALPECVASAVSPRGSRGKKA
uniref:C2 domain-containing protein n=1 Tax=Alexandrium catenella TaxID=2925 RepID=A0A7S1S903_ALECA